MHAHCLILAVVCIVMTGLDIRSSFFAMIAVFFYTISVILNMVLSKVTTSKLQLLAPQQSALPSEQYFACRGLLLRRPLRVPNNAILVLHLHGVLVFDVFYSNAGARWAH